MKHNTITAPNNPNSDVLKIFGIDDSIVEHYDIFHRKDGIHITIKLINKEQCCPVCQTRTTRVVNYIDKKIKTTSKRRGFLCGYKPLLLARV